MQFFIVHFLHGFRNIDGMVGQTLQIADNMKQFGNFQAVMIGKVTTADLDKIGA